MGNEDISTVYTAECRCVQMALQQTQGGRYGTVWRTNGDGGEEGEEREGIEKPDQATR
jgi:hypothetical protein